MSENIRYIKYVSFWEKIGCQKIYGVRIFRVNMVFKVHGRNEEENCEVMNCNLSFFEQKSGLKS